MQFTAQNKKQKIVILGGGFAGMFAAKQLEKRIGWCAEIELISESNFFLFQPLLPEISSGAISSQDILISLRQLLPCVSVNQAVIDQINFDAQNVHVLQGEELKQVSIHYDQLVIALGQSHNMTPFPGFGEHALKIRTLEDAERLRNHVIDKLEHANSLEAGALKKELLTFVIVGGGFSGVETAGEMEDFIYRSLAFYNNVDSKQIKIILIEFGEQLLPELPLSLGAYAKKDLEKRNITVCLKTGAIEASGTEIELTDGSVVATQTIVATIGNAASEFVKSLSISNAKGVIEVQEHLLVKGQTNVWAIGDVAKIPNPVSTSGYSPPTAQMAVQQAKILAQNIERRLENRSPKQFSYKSKGALASLGARRGVANIYGLRITGLSAWLIWRCFYLSFLPGYTGKIRLVIQWILDTVLPRNIIQTRSPYHPFSHYVRFRTGDQIFSKGDIADGFFTIVDGSVKKVHRDSASGEVSEKLLTEGQHFGSRALLVNDATTDRIEAVENSMLLFIPRKDFLLFTKAFPVLKDYFHDYLLQESGSPASPLENTSNQ